MKDAEILREALELRGSGDFTPEQYDQADLALTRLLAENMRLNDARIEAVSLIPHEVWNALPALTRQRVTGGTRSV